MTSPLFKGFSCFFLFYCPRSKREAVASTLRQRFTSNTKKLKVYLLDPIATRLYLCIPEIHLVLLQHLPADHAPVVNDDIKMSPRMELSLPVCNSREGGDDEKGAFDANTVDLFQECD